jgi:hypothetical protein
MSNKEILLEKSLEQIPRLIGLIDRNRFSPTYGCFDRNFWHYKTVDFPTGMAQLGVLPLAYVYSYNFPNNPYYKKERIKELTIAGISYLEKCSHKDGTTDEFYPFERALGATSFSLIACTEAYMVLGLDNSHFVDFFKKRANWMLKNTEPGVIANHQISVALALANLYLITKDKKYLIESKKRIKESLKWFNDEGWFLEYEGCDPGYSTFTIDFLAKYYKKTKDKNVLPILKKLIEFSSYFIAPDGSYGGEYGSRNTSHFYPDGFEIMGNEIPIGLSIVDKYLEGLENRKNEFMNDEKYFFYNLINYLQTYINYREKRVGKLERVDNTNKYFKESKIFVGKKGEYYVIISLAKGGVIKVFKGDKLIYNDSGFIAKTDKGDIITTQIISGNKINVKGENLNVSGMFNKINFKRPTPFTMMIFRALLLCFAWNWKIGSFVKHILTKILITGKKKQPILFERNFVFSEDGIKITSKIKLRRKKKIEQLYIGTDLTLIQVPTSNYFQESVLFKWIDFKNMINKLNKEKTIIIEQNIK